MAVVRDGPSLGAQAERLAAHGERGRALSNSRPVAGVLAGYLAAGAASTLVSIGLGRNPMACDGWWGLRGPSAWLTSVGLGLPLGAATVMLTRIVVRRSAWAHALHVGLRPAVHGASDPTLLALAAASAMGEELLFRGLLVQCVGVIASSILFGTLHQIRGRARWGWMGWATAMGLIFAALFAATGSLLGPIVAHGFTNHANLRFLRDHDPAPRPRPLGGLLRR